MGSGARLALLLLAGAALVLVVRVHWRAPYPVDAILAENGRAVERVLAEHLAQDPARSPWGEPLPDGDAREIIDRLLESVDLDEQERGALDWLGDGYVWQERPSEEAERALLARTRPWVAELQRSVQAPHYLPRNPWQGSVEGSVAPLARWIQVLQVLAAHAREALHEGDVDRALDLHVLHGAAGCDWARRGTLIHALLGAAELGDAEERVARLLAMAEPSAARLARLARELGVLESRLPPLEGAWRTEALWVRQFLAAAAAGHVAEAAEDLGLRPGYASRWIIARTLDAYGPTRRRLTEAYRSTSGLRAWSACQAVVDTLPSGGSPLLRMAFGTHPLTAAKRAQIELHGTLLRVLVALARYRAEHGDLPASLEPLVPTYLPSLPACPLTGQPLHYAADGRVWSVGGDGEDDAGRVIDNHTASDTDGDVVLTLALRELREFPWLDEVEAETRAKVEQAAKDLQAGDLVAAEARDWVEGQERAIASYLVSEFARIERSPGFDSMEGRAMAAAVDGALRRLDGVMEVRWGSREPLDASSDPGQVCRQALRWCNWWHAQLWVTDPISPVASD